MWTAKRTVEPATEPVTLTEVKQILSIPDTYDFLDPILSRFISAGRRTVEQVLNASLVEQTWEMTLDGFPCRDRSGRPGSIELPYGPWISLEDFKYTDYAGTETDLTEDTDILFSARSGRIVPVWDTDWPSVELSPLEPIVITYKTGFVLTVDDAPVTAVPDDIKRAILALVSYWYKNRVPVGEVDNEYLSAVERSIQTYRRSPV